MKATIFATVWFVASGALALATGLLTLCVTDATKPYVWPSAFVMLAAGLALMYCIEASEAIVSMPQATQSGQRAEKAAVGVRTPERAVQGLTIVLSLPCRACLPNVRANRYERIAATEQDRTDACYTALQAIIAQIGYSPRWERAEATVQFRWPNRIRRDTSNYFAGMKPQWDGLVDAGLLMDDEWVIWHIPLPVIDREHPGVQITVAPIAEGE